MYLAFVPKASRQIWDSSAALELLCEELPSRQNNAIDGTTYPITLLKIEIGEKSLHESHGLVNPFPCFL